MINYYDGFENLPILLHLGELYCELPKTYMDHNLKIGVQKN